MKKLLLLFLGMLSFLWIDAQETQKFTISGYIEDAESGEKLITANLFDYKSGKGTVSNTYGFYSLTLPKDSVDLRFSYIGYQTESMPLYLDKDMVINIKLSAEVALQEVEIIAEKYERIEESTQMSTVDIPIAQIKQIPALMGEVDVLKALQLLPGVQSGGEGQNGLYVRGGSPDQNLILLDGVPVYNASHLFGFFSVFNADAIKDVKLIKGGFPARYGGRLSSVIEINMKEGDINEWHGRGSIGLIASKFTIEGPLKKDKTSLIVSARRTYIDILARPLTNQTYDDGSKESGGYFFHDINAKINHKISDKDRLFFSVYTGKDKFYYRYEDRGFDGFQDDEEGNLNWGNITSALRWNHLWSNKLFSNTTLTYSRYKFSLGDKYESTNVFNGVEETELYKQSYSSGIDDVAAKIDFDYVPGPEHYIRFGASAIHHTFSPGTFDLELKSSGDFENNIDSIYGQGQLSSQELAAYIEDDMRLGENFKVNVGVHFSGFNTDGKFYSSIQPRLSMRYLLPNNIALKGSFSTMRQYIQLVANSNIGLPTDLWLPTTKNVKPQDAWQAAIGAAKTFDKRYELSVEFYYKDMKNLIAYKEGSSFFQLRDWETTVTQGNGTSYGGELLLQKKTGRLTGWMGYTYSKSDRIFSELNFGKKFPFKYDRRHDISIVASYKVNKKVQLSATWVYGTGNAITLANSRFQGLLAERTLPSQYFNYNGSYEAEYYADRNNFRMKAYHRMDIGAQFTKKKKRYERTWAIGAYNVYSNKNPFFIFVDSDPSYGPNGERLGYKSVLKQASLFPILPYLSWSFEF